MQSLSLKTNQQTEKLESVLPEFIPVSEIQSESEYIVGDQSPAIFQNCESSQKFDTLVHPDTYVGVKERDRKDFLPNIRVPSIRELMQCLRDQPFLNTLRIFHPRSLLLLFLGWSSVHLA